jgi:hypothetical protein
VSITSQSTPLGAEFGKGDVAAATTSSAINQGRTSISRRFRKNSLTGGSDGFHTLVMILTAYQPRPLSHLGLLDLRGYRLKAYSIVYGDAPFNRAAFDAGLALAERELPRPAITPARPGLGFIIFHQARSGPYLILAWWDNENELPVRVFVADSQGWRPAAAHESFCVWDLRILWHEREAYIRTMLSGPADESAYLADVIEGFA